ncbi:hypothetical protein N0V85_007726 [Neurospora sp. IMI 360204]|nr:hypothetical protein N0V85_007726 [Neurospora sp. IMI 360204]
MLVVLLVPSRPAMLTHCISRRLTHIIPACLLLLLVYGLCLWVKMDKGLRLTGTPVGVNIGGGVAGDAAGNGTDCITAAAAATTEPVTTPDVPAEITGVAAAAVAVAAAAEKPDKAEQTEKAEEAGDKKKKEKEEKDEAAEEKAVAKDVVAWWKQM